LPNVGVRVKVCQEFYQTGGEVTETLACDRLVDAFHERLDQLPDHRQGGPNTRYELKDAALGVFAVFLHQSRSFLAYQCRMQETKGQSNAQSLFRMQQTPTDPQIRNLFDPLAPTELYPLDPEPAGANGAVEPVWGFQRPLVGDVGWAALFLVPENTL
jgi:hypothetical protein